VEWVRRWSSSEVYNAKEIREVEKKTENISDKMIIINNDDR
jgi:hypothetical protein